MYLFKSFSLLLVCCLLESRDQCPGYGRHSSRRKPRWIEQGKLKFLEVLGLLDLVAIGEGGPDRAKATTRHFVRLGDHARRAV